MTATFVSIGAGQAAAVAARTLRRRGFDGAITLIGDEPHAPYERPPLSKEYLQGQAGREDVFILTEEWCAENGVELRLGQRAVRIDTTERAVELADGTRLRADSVLIATGGTPRRLPGVDPGERVIYLRTLDDSERLRAFLGSGRRLITVGAGFIGSEVAASARVTGTDVTVLEMLDVPLQPVLGPRMGAVCAGMHRDHGVDLRTGEAVASVEETADGVLVRTVGGPVVEGDAVVIGIGIVPSTAVAEASGIETDNGVVVDEHLRTSVEGVFAAGDVANHYHPVFERRLRVEHFDNASRQAMTVAKNVVGGDAVFDDPHWFWSDQYDHNLQYAGHASTWDDVVVRGTLEERDFIAFYRDGGVVRAVFAIDRGGDVFVAKDLIAQRVAAAPELLEDEAVELSELLPAG